ncbi:hypothetical protein [Streptomyces sp. NPDC059949]|uniref:hypothetical protein n=1 Tax=Streptomyces sp. NPDC059949 TaxID=3347013 RepID=UPI00364F0BBF
MAPSTMTRIRTLRLAGTAIVCAVTAASLAGCDSGTKAASSPSASASASPSSDPDQAAKDKVLAAYTNMREIQIKMADDGDLHTLELGKYAKGQASTDLKKSVLRNQAENIKFTGRPGMDPKVTAVDTKNKTATVTDCFDATAWKPVYKDSGKPVEMAEQRLRYPATSHAELEGDTWRITEITADRSQGC